MRYEGNMEQQTKKIKVINYIDELPPEVRRGLETKQSYQRYIFERARLEKMATDSFRETGKYTNEEVVTQNRLLDKLGDEVLLEIKAMCLLRDEPSYEEFQKMRQE